MRRPIGGALLALAAGACLLGGCVYYNGMYNTNRLANSARKAERDGRVFEANNLWGQVITRADSLVMRHPRSKYADEATVLRGLALARLEQCPAAVGPLGRVSVLERAGDLTEEAALALGHCQMELGDAALADLAFVRIIQSGDPVRRREARFQHAHALRIAGRYPEALAVLRDNPDPRAANDLLLSLVGSGQTDAALALADSLLASKDTVVPWDSVIVALGAESPRVASALVGRLRADVRPPAEVRARRLYDDAVRLAAVDTAGAVARLKQAIGVPGRTESGERARLLLLQLALSGARSLDDLATPADSLAALAARGSGAAGDAALLDAMVVRLRRLPDSASAGAPRGDLRVFMAAEDARDGLRAPALAAALFRQLADQWAASPYAPKALLAAEQLEPSDDGAARMRLDSLYAGSPYLAVLRGEDDPAYRVLEDSLEAFAVSQTVAPSRPRPGARRPVEVNEPEPRLRRRPRQPADENPPGTRRALEP